MIKIFAAYTNKQLIAEILRTFLAVIYLSLLAAVIWLCRDFTPGYVIDSIIPYGIPPLISLLCAAFLSLFVLSLEQTRTETLLFSIICLAFAGLNADIFILGIIKNPDTALLISRMDHFVLALVQLGANLHLVYLVSEKKDHWWIVYLAYGIGAIMALFTPTDLYFHGIYTYYWGFFAKKAIMYDLMSILWMMATAYSIFLLFTSFGKTADRHKRDTIKFLLLGFVSSAVLSFTNTPAMYGYEIYPLGTFTFISLLLLAYGLFKYNLRIALQQLRSVIFTAGHLSIITAAAFIPAIFLPDNAHHLKLTAGVITVAVLYHPVHKLWDFILSLFLKRSSELLQKELYVLTYRLSEIHHLKKIHREICFWLFRIFMNSRCAMVFADADNRSFNGWQTFNPDPFSGFFSRSVETSPAGDAPLRITADHPILNKIISTKARLITPVMLSRWMDEQQLPNDPADRLLQAGIIIPIFSQNRLIGLVLIGSRLNDRSYTGSEKEIFENIGAILGPVIENAKLLEGLERKVHIRTRNLDEALKALKQKNSKISENHTVIKKQNHIFLSLFETTTHIHAMDELHELFADTLNQLRSLFPHLGFGIIHEGERVGILESGAFIGISEREQTVILENRQHLTRHNINPVLTEKMQTPEKSETSSTLWTVQPMVVGDNHVIGKIIIKGPLIDPFTNKVISIFLAQVAAAAHNKFLMNKLEINANTDGLTGVANRSCFDGELKKTMKNAALFPNIYFSIIMIDINGLKRINDNFGHDKGDEMIRTLANMLSSVCRETDTLSRIGGDEFIILMPATSSALAKVAVDRIRSKETELFLICRQKSHQRQTDFDETTLPIRFSIGVAGSDETLPENVLKLADQRMYVDKENFYQNTIEDTYAEHS